MTPFNLKNAGDLSKNPIAIFYIKWAAIYAVILIATISAGAYLFSSGAKTRAEIKAIQSKLAGMPEANMTAEQRGALMDSIKNSAETENRQFIPASDISTALSGISAAASRHNINLKRVNTLPAKEITGYPYRGIPILMEAEGAFQDAGNFLMELRTDMPWSFTWERAQIKKSTQNPALLQFELRIVFYTRTA